MISRVRFDAYGSAPADVAAQLEAAARHYEGQQSNITVSGNVTVAESPGTSSAIFVGGGICARGEQVIERQLEEPEGSLFAFRGRLVLHPDISQEVA